MSLKNEENKSLRLIPNLLVVAPANEMKAREILYADQISGTTNILKGTAELLVVPDLSTNEDAWYLLCTTRPMKPLIFQDRKPVKFVPRTRDDDESVFMNSEYIYGADARGNAGYGFWQMAYGSDGTTS